MLHIKDKGGKSQILGKTGKQIWVSLFLLPLVKYSIYIFQPQRREQNMIFHWRILDLLIMKQMCSRGTVPSLSTPSPHHCSFDLCWNYCICGSDCQRRHSQHTKHRDLKNRAPDPRFTPCPAPTHRCPRLDLIKTEGEIWIPAQHTWVVPTAP